MKYRKRQFIEGKGLQLLSGINLSIIIPIIIGYFLVWILEISGIKPDSISQWIIIFPLLYMAFLLTTLSLFALLNIVSMNSQRPSSFDTRKDSLISNEMKSTHRLYTRMYFVYSLPLVSFLYKVGFFQWLIMRSYGYGQDIGKGCRIYGRLDDPELITLGDDCVIGNDARLVAHSYTMYPGRHFLYLSAPIHLNKRVTVGGNSLIQLGTKIDNDAIIEPGSVIPPFSRIGKGEVWGGNPATLKHIRKNYYIPEKTNEKLELVTNISDNIFEQEIINLIAKALEVSNTEFDSQTQACDIDQWDSLGMMAIFAAMYDQFEITVPYNERSDLNSIQAIINWLRNSKKNEAINSDPKFRLPTNPELFPLLNAKKVTSKLLTNKYKPQITNTCKVCVVSTFTIDPLASSLKLWTSAFGIAVDIHLCSFNQVLQELLSEKSNFANNKDGLNIVITRPEDLLRAKDPDGADILSQYRNAFNTYFERTNTPLAVSNLPPPLYPFEQELVNAKRLTANWEDMLLEFTELSILDLNSIIISTGIDHAKDYDGESKAAKPFSDSIYQNLGIAISRIIRSLYFPSARVIALDCDNTLWKGVIGEDGLDGIGLDPTSESVPFITFQHKLKELKEKGVLLVLVSRNNPEDVWEVFDKHPNMILNRDDITTSRINWRQKSANLHSIANELNLGLSSFVFIDDSRHEQLDVETTYPEVTILPPPTDSQRFSETLSKLWIFDNRNITVEDSARATFMNQEKGRTEAQKSASTLDIYLRDLKLEITVRPVVKEDLVRVNQLILKTNQFNLSLHRYTNTEIVKQWKSHWMRVIEVNDKFGEYGIVGLAIIIPTTNKAESFAKLDTFLLSCRALGRFIENTFLYALQKEIMQEGIITITADFYKGPRNQPVCEFLLESGFKRVKTEGNREEWIQHPVKPITIPNYINLKHITKLPIPMRPLSTNRANY